MKTNIIFIIILFIYSFAIFGQTNCSNVLIIKQDVSFQIGSEIVSNNINPENIVKVSFPKQYQSKVYFYIDRNVKSNSNNFEIILRTFYKINLDTFKSKMISYQKIKTTVKFGLFSEIFEYHLKKIYHFTTQESIPGSIESLISIMTVLRNTNIDFFKNRITYSDYTTLYINDFSLKFQIPLITTKNIKSGYSISNPTFSTNGKYITFIYQYPYSIKDSTFHPNNSYKRKIVCFDIYNLKLIPYYLRFDSAEYAYYNNELNSFLILTTPFESEERDVIVYNILENKIEFIGKGLSACWTD